MPVKRLMRKDLLVTMMDDNEMNKTKSGIVLGFNKEKDTTHYYKVHMVGPDVRDVKVGDIVLVEWKNVTTRFLVDNEYFQITDEEQVMCIRED